MALADKILEEAKQKEIEEVNRKYAEGDKLVAKVEKEAAAHVEKESQDSAKVDEQFDNAMTAAGSKTATPED